MTGGSGGIGKELITILYAHNAKVYVAARSRDKTVKIIDEIKRTTTSPKGGDLIFLPLQLDNLTTIKSSASIFLAREPRLDILFLNAGAMIPPHGSTTAQGHGLQLGINNLGHFLFAQLLTPLMTHTVTSGTAPRNSVRMIWVSSSAADSAPKPAVDFANIDYAHEEGLWTKYMRSKAGNAIHAVEFARRLDGTGVLSMVCSRGYIRQVWGALTVFCTSFSPLLLSCCSSLGLRLFAASMCVCVSVHLSVERVPPIDVVYILPAPGALGH